MGFCGRPALAGEAAGGRLTGRAEGETIRSNRAYLGLTEVGDGAGHSQRGSESDRRGGRGGARLLRLRLDSRPGVLRARVARRAARGGVRGGVAYGFAGPRRFVWFGRYSSRFVQ